MKAVLIKEFGGIDKVRFEEEYEDPKAEPQEAVVNIKVAALNHLDLLVVERKTAYLEGSRLPLVIGSDGSGVIEELGEGGTEFKVGDKVVLYPGLSCGVCPQCRGGEQSQCMRFSVMGAARNGMFAEKVKVPLRSLYPAPARLSFREAAAFPLVFLTAWRMLTTKARLKAGEDVLIHGIGGGVSSAALQLSALIGARVIVTSSSQGKLDRALKLGASYAINYKNEDVLRQVEEYTGSRGVDVVIDNVGYATWDTSIKALGRGGRLVTCGRTVQGNPQIDIGTIYRQQLSIHGSTLGNDREMRSLLRIFDKTSLRPLIDAVYPLADAAKAEERLAHGEQMGKIVLEI
jgi:NADPH:quinone reductase-like Zn-dependent oxidoreductase